MKEDLIAPCGMNCRLCYAYIRRRNPCLGCNSHGEGKLSSRTNCRIVLCEKRNENGWPTCADCDCFCQRLIKLDRRYRSKNHMSMIENLHEIHDLGMDEFLERQDREYRCPDCGEIVSVHRNECPACGRILW